MIRYAVDRSRPTGGGMTASVVVHGVLLLMLGVAMRQGASLPIPPEELTKISYIEAHQGENVAQKIRTRTMATRHPKLAEGRGVSTRAAQKPKPLGQPGRLPKIERPTREKMAEIATPMPTPQQTKPQELAVAPRLQAKNEDLAQVEVATPRSRRESAVDDASSATPRLQAKAAPRSFDGATNSLESKRSTLDLAGGDIDPAPRTSTGATRGVAETGHAGPGRATLKPSNGSGNYRGPAAGLTPSRSSAAGIADVGADRIAASGGGGSDDRGGRRTILDYGSGSGGGLRGRAGGDALATDRGTVDPTRRTAEKAQSRVADTAAADLSSQGMDMSISGQISGRKILSVVSPEYSRTAKQKGWEGVVAVHFTVLPDGRVKDNLYHEQASAHRDLNQSAMAAIRQFRFARLPNEDPQIEQWGVITFVFRLK
jgi:TonB family protein